jgi:hypothetical protein
MANDNDIKLADVSPKLDTLDILHQDEVEDKVEDKDEDKNEDKSETEDAEGSDKESKSDEEEIEIKDEEPVKEDEDEFHDVPARKAILKEFPELFKKFPAIERSIYREQQYSEVFPTIKDARAAHEMLTNYGQLENSLMQGKSYFLLKNLKEGAPKAFDKYVDGFLSELAEVDEKSSQKLINRIVKNTLYNTFAVGKRKANETLQKAAQILHDAIYGTEEVSPDLTDRRPGKSEDNEEDDREKQLREREAQYYHRQLADAVDDVTERSQNILKSTIDKHIDPKEQMTAYVRNKAQEDAYKEVHDQLLNDKRFRATINRLWQEASSQGNITEAHKQKIRNAILAKAKTLLPGAISKARNEALKGIIRKSRDVEDEKPVARGRNIDNDDRKSSKNSFKNVKELPKNLSTRELLDME